MSIAPDGTERFQIHDDVRCPRCDEFLTVRLTVKIVPVIGGAQPHFVEVRGGTPHDCEFGPEVEA